MSRVHHLHTGSVLRAAFVRPEPALSTPMRYALGRPARSSGGMAHMYRDMVVSGFRYPTVPGIERDDKSPRGLGFKRAV